MPQTTPGNHPTALVPTLYITIELAQKEWKLGFSEGGSVRVRAIAARDFEAFFTETALARRRLDLAEDARTVIAYEAGRDGFWLARLLESQGFEVIIMDAASIQVSRKARRAKTDRLDVTSLNRHLVRWDRGDNDALSVVRLPSVEEEDARRREREQHRLTRERGQHSNRIKSLLTLHGIELGDGRVHKELDVDAYRQWDGQPLPPRLVEEIKRELARLTLVEEQLAELAKARREELQEESTQAAKQVTTLMTLRGIGEGTAWPLVQEAFSFRDFRNRRELASYVGLDPTPWMSGEMDQTPGISKSGNRRLRVLLVEAAWSWLRYQPESPLTLWFNERFGTGKRSRRIGIVALARRLLIALWRMVRDGVVPENARLKSV